MNLDLYGIPNCDSVKKARAALAERGWTIAFHDLKKGGVTADRLRRWQQAAGWETLLNRRGTTWKQLSAREQASAVDAAGALALMQAHLSLIKRPVIEWPDGRLTVGLLAEWPLAAKLG